MSDLVNPFVPGQPVEQAALFVGRRDALAWARENLVKGRRVFVVYAPRRMGKTSLLLEISRELPPDTVAAYWSLADEERTSPEELIPRLASVVRSQLQERHDLAILEPALDEAERDGTWLAEVFWPEVRGVLGQRTLLFLLDDLEALAEGGEARLASFVEVLASLREADTDLALLCAFGSTDADQLARRYPSLFGGALFWPLGPLTGDDAVQVLTWSVGGALTYDYGVPRRIVELTSGHPHYLQLLGYVIFERCARQGWVNQRDVDLAVESLIQRDLPEFSEVWDSLDALERVALAAIASLRGGRGVATRQEIRTALERARLKASREDVQHALNRLVQRGILQQLGALSFRYRVDLFRLWLAQRFQLPDLVADARAARATKRDRTGRRRWGVRRTRGVVHVAEEDDEAAAAQAGRRRLQWWWALGVVPVVAGLIWLVASLANRPAMQPQPTAAPIVAGTATSTAVASERVASPTKEATAAPTLPAPATSGSLVTPSPTAPVVVTGQLPAVAYQVYARPSNNWDIWLMNSDGSKRSQLTDDRADDTSPAWSPAGSRIVFVSYRDDNAEIYVTSAAGGEAVNLTQHPAKDWNPAWSPDGEWIAFASLRDSLHWELYLMRADGSEVTRLTWWDDASDLGPTWGPDGKRLAFASRRDGNWELYVINRDGSGLARLTDHPADDMSPAWSPDGTRIAFESTRDGNVEIYVMPAAGGEAVNLSNEPFADDHGPSWSPDGHRLAFYSNRDREWDIYVMNDDGSDAVRLTGDQTNDQVPAWRP